MWFCVFWCRDEAVLPDRDAESAEPEADVIDVIEIRQIMQIGKCVS